MNKLLGVCFFLTFLFSITLADSKIKLLIPLYIDPTGPNDKNYAAVGAASSKITVVSIINPNNGPANLDSDWSGALTKLKQANTNSNTGSYTVGYVYTKMGSRSISSVKADIKKYASWPATYRPNGIFFDEMSDSKAKLSYYQEIYNYTKQQFGESSKVFGNPGYNFPKEYLCSGGSLSANNVCTGKRAIDTGITFESFYSDWKSFKVSSYASTVDRNQLGVLIHTCLAGNLKAAIDKVVNSNAGFVYITNDKMDNPWDTLATFFTDEINYIANLK